MKTMLDYVKTCMTTFDTVPLNSVDALVLSQVAMIEMRPFTRKKDDTGSINWADTAFLDLTFSEMLKLEEFENMFTMAFSPQETKEMLLYLSASPRFRELRIRHYVSEYDNVEAKQFSATTFIIPSGGVFVAFKGTDATLTGWKEDFAMSFSSQVPAQGLAVQYLNMVAKESTGSLVVSGHSKGGNLAVYGAMMCSPEVQERITNVYSMDGPGFRHEVTIMPEYARIVPKITKIVPQGSIVGLLMESLEDFTVVHSNAVGIMQHMPFSWEVVDNDFVYMKNLAANALRLDGAISSWLSELDDTSRRRLVDLMFETLTTGSSQTVQEINSGGIKQFQKMIFKMRDLDDADKTFLRGVLGSLTESTFDNLFLAKSKTTEIMPEEKKK